MDVFLGEWANLLLRWAHLAVGIGWIGTSFYFIALDYSLDPRERASPGIAGTAWQVHGGGFYRVEKFLVAPPRLLGNQTGMTDAERDTLGQWAGGRK
jgi:uncharacterized membrane protein